MDEYDVDNYRDIHEYHDPCYYCICSKCKTDSCRWIECEFCPKGISGAREKCSKKCKDI